MAQQLECWLLFHGTQALFPKPMWLLTLSVTPVLGDQVPPGFCGHQVHTCYTYCTQAKYSDTYSKSERFKKICFHKSLF